MLSHTPYADHPDYVQVSGTAQPMFTTTIQLNSNTTI